MSNGQKNQSTISTQRLEAFSDSVFAIVITLLFFKLEVPKINDVGDWRELLAALYALLPEFTSIAVSFLYVAVFWVAHHQFFHTLKETTRALLWLNLIFLSLVCFVPFPAAILIKYPGNQTSVVIFGIALFLIGVMLATLRRYAWVRHQEINSLVHSQSAIKKAWHRSLLITFIILIGLAISFFHPFAAIIIYLLAPLTLLFPIRVEVEKEDGEESSEVVL